MIRELALSIEVLGEAKPAGSKRAFKNPKTGRIIVTDDSKGSKPWKQQVAGTAREAFTLCSRCGGDGMYGETGFYELDPQGDGLAPCPACDESREPRPLLTGPLSVEFIFYRKRPAGHYGSGRRSAFLRPSAPSRPSTRPDLLKLARAAEDALNGVVYRDDAQIVEETLHKFYGEPERTVIRVWTLRELDQPQLKEAA